MTRDEDATRDEDRSDDSSFEALTNPIFEDSAVSPTLLDELGTAASIMGETGVSPTLLDELGTAASIMGETGVSPTLLDELGTAASIMGESGVPPTLLGELGTAASIMGESGVPPTLLGELGTAASIMGDTGVEPTPFGELGTAASIMGETGVSPTLLDELGAAATIMGEIQASSDSLSGFTTHIPLNPRKTPSGSLSRINQSEGSNTQSGNSGVASEIATFRNAARFWFAYNRTSEWLEGFGSRIDRTSLAFLASHLLYFASEFVVGPKGTAITLAGIVMAFYDRIYSTSNEGTNSR